jgi:hypothetical protein
MHERRTVELHFPACVLLLLPAVMAGTAAAAHAADEVLDDNETALHAAAAAEAHASAAHEADVLAAAGVSTAARAADAVTLNVGGSVFTTTRATLQADPHSFLGVMFSGRHALRLDDQGHACIDRSPAAFDDVLTWLRCRALPPTNARRRALYAEADFYAMQGLLSELERCLDGSAHRARCLQAVMDAGGACYAEEQAARARYAAARRAPRAAGAPPPVPELSGVASTLPLLRPLSDAAHHATFVYAADEDSGLTTAQPEHACFHDDDDAGVPLLLTTRRRLGAPGAASICPSLAAYRLRFDLFTRGHLRALDWRGVLVAGGACLGPLLPLPGTLADDIVAAKPEQSALWETLNHYHAGWPQEQEDGRTEPDGEPPLRFDTTSDLGYGNEDDDGAAQRSCFEGSDVDIFLYGLDEDEARAKVAHIGACLRATGSVLGVARSAHAVTFERAWPHRHVQVILRLYGCVEEVLASFDVDCCAVGFDGTDVLALPRCRAALNRAANVADPSRRSPTYESRLWKYAMRGFAVALPGYTGALTAEEMARRFEDASSVARLVLLDAQSQPHAARAQEGVSIPGRRVLPNFGLFPPGMYKLPAAPMPAVDVLTPPRWRLPEQPYCGQEAPLAYSPYHNHTALVMRNDDGAAEPIVHSEEGADSSLGFLIGCHLLAGFTKLHLGTFPRAEEQRGKRWAQPHGEDGSAPWGRCEPREEAPPLPWLYSRRVKRFNGDGYTEADVTRVMDARADDGGAFEYTWLQCDCPDPASALPPGVPGCANLAMTRRLERVAYKTSLPLRAQFADDGVAAAATAASGVSSFYPLPADDFYRGMVTPWQLPGRQARRAALPQPSAAEQILVVNVHCGRSGKHLRVQARGRCNFSTLARAAAGKLLAPHEPSEAGVAALRWCVGGLILSADCHTALHELGITEDTLVLLLAWQAVPSEADEAAADEAARMEA